MTEKMKIMNTEKLRLNDINYRTWGPYVSNRQWGNVREDYTNDGNTCLLYTSRCV